MLSLVRRLAAGAMILALAAGARADYPDRQIAFVVPFAAGSATDQLARALGIEVTRITKQPVIVDDKPGASGFIGAEVVKKAAPDGYTVFITTNTTHAANEHLFKKLPYDPVKDFTPVTGMKSFTGSYGIFLNRCSFAACVVLVVMNTV